jgi:hypothetical protein
MLLDFSIDDIPWQHGKDLYRLWDELRSKKPWPSRKQLSPQNMSPYLKDIMLIDVQNEPSDFVVRLAGTGYMRFIPKDPTGDSIRTFNNGANLMARFAKMLELKKPYLGLDQPIPWADPMYQYKRFDGMMLPLSDGNTDNISILMLLVNYHN